MTTQIESIVCDLEFAEKLYNLEIKKNSLYTYFMSECEAHKNWLKENRIYIDTEKIDEIDTELYHAYTTDELLEMLPTSILHNDTINDFEILRGYTFYVNYFSNVTKKVLYNSCNNKLSNALAKMVIKLIEDKILKVEGINK